MFKTAGVILMVACLHGALAAVRLPRQPDPFDLDNVVFPEVPDAAGPLSAKAVAPPVNEPAKVFCVYGSWAILQEGALRISDIRAELCDYLVFAYAELSSGGGLVVTPDPKRDLDASNGSYAELRRLKEIYPHLKTLIGIGGHRVSSDRFSRASAVPRIRQGLAIGAAEFARFHGFDGAALAWYYPGQGENHDGSRDPDNLSHLVKVMGQRLHSYGMELAVFVSPIEEDLNKGYRIEDLASWSDYVLALTFDYHGPWEERVRHYAPLRQAPPPPWRPGTHAAPPAWHIVANSSANEVEPEVLSVENSVDLLLDRGLPPHKLIMGIGTFGRSFTLLDPTRHRIGDRAIGPGLPGPRTKESGFLAYNELCENLVKSPVVLETNTWGSRGPYTFLGDQWSAFEDEDSVIRKVLYLQQRGIGGALLWTLDSDDHNNLCSAGSFPLHAAALRALGRNVTRHF